MLWRQQAQGQQGGTGEAAVSIDSHRLIPQVILRQGTVSSPSLRRQLLQQKQCVVCSEMGSNLGSPLAGCMARNRFPGPQNPVYGEKT